MIKTPLSIVWLRRDLRLHDNHALYNALQDNESILPLFIFDTEIIEDLQNNDHRVGFIYSQLSIINKKLNDHNSSLLCVKGNVLEVFIDLIETYTIKAVYCNEDYEPYSRQRDQSIKEYLSLNNIDFHTSKDQVIFEKDEICKSDGLPYTVFTPYKKKWLSTLRRDDLNPYVINQWNKLVQYSFEFPTLEALGFVTSTVVIENYDIDHLSNYEEDRNLPAKDNTSKLSAHLRFGTVGIRELISKIEHNQSFFNELIWREFFMQILFHFPKVVTNNFRPKYDGIKWRNNPEDFEKWKSGTTGFPMVDAGMRQLNETGYMHNRVRMVVASFLCKDLLIDWRWGEAYFAEKLSDYELSSNNGNWQWAAGCGCDAAPYFRVFNPHEQQKRYDASHTYIKRWIHNYDKETYLEPMIDHSWARNRCLKVYKEALSEYNGS